MRLHDPDGASRAEQTAALKAAGCLVVRTEAPPAPGGQDFTVLNSILDFIAEGDQLVIGGLEHLGASGRAMLRALERLEERGASLYVIEPELRSTGPGGPALHAALAAVASAEPIVAIRHRRPAANQEIRALQRAGVGPVEIARRLGVSRMTVWRKLKAMEACG
ncbi:HTH domain-containing protein [Phenylobacterium sp.]|uniref:HTH domain-containing protein n=1 Tax=Phenylobacterium sp. TaxID=1871053 RepID=UPI00356ABB2C